MERLKPALLAVHATEASARRLRQLAEEASWSHVRELALVFIPEPIGVHLPRNQPMTCIPPEFKDDLVCFFQAFRAITELNLNTFHFSKDLSFPGIAETSRLNRLRALSVAPCALRASRFSMEHLAFACPRLEELDVRSNNTGGPAWPCFTCNSREPFILSRQGLVVESWLASEVGAKGLQTLTLYKVPGFYSFSFLPVCRVTELRLSGVDAINASEFIGLGRRLCANANLRNLTIEHADLPIDARSMWTELSKLKSLHFLCLLSASQASQAMAVNGAETLLHTLPLLEGLHLHFEGPNVAGKVRLTWFRKRAGVQGPSQNVAEEPEFLTLVGKPCVQCCMTTFIGLEKPRYRGWSSL